MNEVKCHLRTTLKYGSSGYHFVHMPKAKKRTLQVERLLKPLCVHFMPHTKLSSAIVHMSAG